MEQTEKWLSVIEKSLIILCCRYLFCKGYSLQTKSPYSLGSGGNLSTLIHTFRRHGQHNPFSVCSHILLFPSLVEPKSEFGAALGSGEVNVDERKLAAVELPLLKAVSENVWVVTWSPCPPSVSEQRRSDPPGDGTPPPQQRSECGLLQCLQEGIRHLETQFLPATGNHRSSFSPVWLSWLARWALHSSKTESPSPALSSVSRLCSHDTPTCSPGGSGSVRPVLGAGGCGWSTGEPRFSSLFFLSLLRLSFADIPLTLRPCLDSAAWRAIQCDGLVARGAQCFRTTRTLSGNAHLKYFVDGLPETVKVVVY